jgi:hypothetical protein
LAILRYQNRYGDLSIDGSDSFELLLEESYQVLLERLPQQKWAEYFDGPTGIWIGQQARNYQTWTIAGFLLVHHFLKVNPADSSIMNLPNLNQILQSKPQI